MFTWIFLALLALFLLSCFGALIVGAFGNRDVAIWLGKFTYAMAGVVLALAFIGSIYPPLRYM